MLKCELCNKEHDGTYGSGRFCSQKCSRSFSTKSDNKLDTKHGECSVCGIKMIVNKRTSSKQVKCSKCTKRWSNGTSINKCNICGNINSKECKRRDICLKYKSFSGLNKYFGFDLSTIGSEKVYNEYEIITNKLKEDYYDNELSSVQMAKKYGHYNTGNFTKILKSLGIKLRTLSNSQMISVKNGVRSTPTNPRYKNGYHTTWDGRQVFYRSSYELRYAKELDDLKIEYVMESLRILYWDSQKNKQRIAIPDFYLPKNNTIVEIKSEWTLDEQNMKDKEKEYIKHGYKFKLLIMD